VEDEEKPVVKVTAPPVKTAPASTPFSFDEDEEEEQKRPTSKALQRRKKGDDDDDEEMDTKARKKGRISKKKTFEFDGSAGDYFKVALLSWLLTAITFGFGSPWAMCMIVSWQASHTLVNGRRLRFDGKGGEFFVQYLIFYVLTCITCGIYLFWGVPKIIRWFTENMEFEDGE
jgi:uncharacterized membrane protein YjgN (DUF898 family)